MANQDQGSKTELPTNKKLKDARKKGDVAKVPEVSLTFGFIFALVLLWLVSPLITEGFTALLEEAMSAPTKTFDKSIATVGEIGWQIFVGVSALVIIPLAVFSLVVEFLVIGPVFTSEKFKPKGSNLNPAEGLKRMFGMDNLVELLKSVAKTLVLGFIFYFAIAASLNELILLPSADEDNVAGGLWYISLRIVGMVSIAFILILFFDASYQKHAFTKKMKMSIRDIRDELKETEGDPLLKGARKDLGQEWAQAPPTEAAAQANVLVVNPIHVAIALVYDAEKTKVPIVTGKGEEQIARDMRQAAAIAGVPVLRNEKLARALLADRTEGNYVPKELFDIVAEVILWAQAVRDKNRAGSLTPPGEDLTGPFVSHTRVAS
jgi:flagellar biosynthesis protein FlhB